MRRLGRELQRIARDLFQGRNVESYLVVIVGLALVLLDIVGEVPTSTQLSVIIAALVVLIYRESRQTDKSLDLDSVLQDRTGYTPFREFVRGAREVWVYGASGVNALKGDSGLVSEVLDKGGKVRALIQDPAQTESIAILRQQLDKLNDLEIDLQSVLYTLRRVQAERSAAFEYRLLPYNPGFSLIIVNPNSRNGKVTVEFYGYHNDDIGKRMHIVIERDASQHWFDYWRDQFEMMWNAARVDTSTPAIGASDRRLSPPL